MSNAPENVNNFSEKKDCELRVDKIWICRRR